MASYDNEDGVWRTIGGRRIFIRDGESLSSAMKKSGKFKSTKKKLSEKDEDDIRKSMQKVAEQYEKDKKEGKVADRLKQIEDEEREKRLEDKKEGENKKETPNERSKQYSDIEKASGLKVERSFQTDAYGNGDEDHFELSDGRTVVHSRESLGKKEDSWSIETIEKGSINSQSFKSYDEMIDHLKGGSGSNDKYSDYYKKENLGTPSNYKQGDQIEYKSSYGETIKGTIVREANDGEKEFRINKNLKGYVVRDANGNEHVVADTRIKEKSDNRINHTAKEHEEYLKRNPQKGDYIIGGGRKGEDVKVGKDGKLVPMTNRDYNEVSPYKKAFEEYKKKHPNSKLTLNKFIDMSEGK